MTPTIVVSGAILAVLAIITTLGNLARRREWWSVVLAVLMAGVCAWGGFLAGSLYDQDLFTWYHTN